MRVVFKILHYLLGLLLAPVVLLVALLSRARRSKPWGKPHLVWGPDPLINIKYWSGAMRKRGYQSTTFVYQVYTINERQDFDLYLNDLLPWTQANAFTRRLWSSVGQYYCFCRVVQLADIVHLPFCWGFLRTTPLYRCEYLFYRIAGIKIVVIGFGGDFYQYSTIHDASVRHALLHRYPYFGKHEREVRDQVDFCNRHGDCVIPMLMIDGASRWDVLVFSAFVIDESLWRARESYSPHDGRSGPVRVLHTPNHRCIKGTEYLIKAVDELKSEGLQLELILLEGVKNEVVREAIYQADILAEQFVITGYAISGIEGMATGVVHMCNLEDAYYTRVFRRYSYLDECPSVSTDLEHIKDNLRTLVISPNLRERLGRAGRRYMEKYHSESAAHYLFSAVYDKIWANKDVDLMNLFHPAKRQNAER